MLITVLDNDGKTWQIDLSAVPNWTGRRWPEELLVNPERDIWLRCEKGGDGLWTAVFLQDRTIARWWLLMNDIEDTLSSGNSIRLNGNSWTVTYGGETWSRDSCANDAPSRLKLLLQSPGKRIKVLDLIGVPLDKRGSEGRDDGSDAEAVHAVKMEMTRLIQEISKASARDDESGAERLQAEFEKLASHIKNDAGFKNRRRKCGPAAREERAHHGEAKKLRDLFNAMKIRCPKLAEHLKTSLDFAYPHIAYMPVHPVDWNF